MAVTSVSIERMSLQQTMSVEEADVTLNCPLALGKFLGISKAKPDISQDEMAKYVEAVIHSFTAEEA